MISRRVSSATSVSPEARRTFSWRQASISRRVNSELIQAGRLRMSASQGQALQGLGVDVVHQVLGLLQAAAGGAHAGQQARLLALVGLLEPAAGIQVFFWSLIHGVHPYRRTSLLFSVCDITILLNFNMQFGDCLRLGVDFPSGNSHNSGTGRKS